MRSATALKQLGRIRVGLIGPAGPAMTACFEALQRSSDYVVVGAASLSAAAMVADPGVDLAAIFSTGQAAFADAGIAIRAGRDVYLHSPLTIDATELVELLALAQDNNVRHIVGLPRRLSQPIRFAADLVKDGYVGKLQIANLDAESSLDAAVPSTPPAMTVHVAEVLDAMFSVVGWPRLLFGFQAGHGAPSGATRAQLTQARFPSASDWAQLYAAGSLGDDAAFSIRFVSRHRGRAAIKIQISGDDGDLVMVNSRPRDGREDRWRVAGARGSGLALRTLAVPKSYAWSADELPPVKSRAILNIFAAFARDLHEVTALAPTLDDAIRLQHLSHAIVTSAESGRRIVI